MATDTASGHFITVGAVTGPDGKRHGGHVIHIEGNHVNRGHPSITPPGKPVKKISPSHAIPAHWKQEATEAKINPDHLHQLAHELRAHDKEYADSVTRMLQRAREVAKKAPSRFGSVSHLSHAFRGGDLTQIRGFDLLASQMRHEYPELFAGHHEGQEESHRGARENSGSTSADERLYDLLHAGNQKPMTMDAAYRQALDHLHQHASNRPKRSKPVYTDAVPFSNAPTYQRVAALLRGHKGPLPGDAVFVGREALLSAPASPPPITSASVLSPQEIDRILTERADLLAGKHLAPKAPPTQRPAITADTVLSDEEVDRILDERAAAPAWGDRYRV